MTGHESTRFMVCLSAHWQTTSNSNVTRTHLCNLTPHAPQVLDQLQKQISCKQWLQVVRNGRSNAGWRDTYQVRQQRHTSGNYWPQRPTTTVPTLYLCQKCSHGLEVGWVQGVWRLWFPSGVLGQSPSVGQNANSQIYRHSLQPRKHVFQAV